VEIITYEQALQGGQKFGPKADNLVALQKLGFTVPRFVILSDLDNQKLDLQTLKQLLNVDKYIVRSSSQTEDEKNNSNAGQFKSICNLQFFELKKAIQDVCADAQTKLVSLKGFSIIIQQYLQAEYSGIFFTRNPMGGREYVIEYHKGSGEQIVSGKVKPQKLLKYWHEDLQYIKHEWLSELVFQTSSLEKKFAWPQDVEWLVKKGKIFIVQTRPLTTIREVDYQTALFIDNYWKNADSQCNFLEKTYLYESVPRPGQLMQDVLADLYDQDGPIAFVYGCYGLHYEANNFREIVGNELYVDRDAEVQELLPAYKYDPQTNQNVLQTLNPQKIFISLENLLKLKAIKPDRLQELKNELTEVLQKPIQPNASFANLYAEFLRKYALIFELNFLLSNCNLKSDISFALPQDLQTQFSNWKGNGLDIADTSAFVWTNSATIELRELGRFVTVKYINALRNALPKNVPLEIYLHSNLEAVMDDKIDKQQAESRLKSYQSNSNFVLPTKLSRNFVQFKTTTIIQVSKGIVQGKLVTIDLQKQPADYRDMIIYVENLTPDLTRYFPFVKGIVAENGGLLSHLAIIAREKALPVIVGLASDKAQSLLNNVIEMGAENDLLHFVS
jgi:phosphohistidine swiveling domain-containing protein